MIIIKYLIREILKSQLVILFILLLIFFCQKLIKILSAATNGEIPINLVFTLLGLGIPEMAQLILPLSLSLSLLTTLGKLYIEGEITAMYACGLSRFVLIKAAMIPAFFTSITMAISVVWAIPWSLRHQKIILVEAKTRPSLASLSQGQFHQISNGNSILFIESFDNGYFHGIFLAQPRSKGNVRPFVIVADSGRFSLLKDGSQVVTLNKGTRFEGTAILHDFHITNFQDYQAIIEYQVVTSDSSDIEQMSMNMLWNTNTSQAHAELNWRITLICIIFIMALISIPLSVVRGPQGQVLTILLAMLLYLMFFLLQTSIKSDAEKGKVDPVFWMWVVNGTYFLLAIVLNFWGTVSVHHLRALFRCQGAP